MAGVSGACVVARFMDEIVVGVLAFRLVFAFGSQLCLVHSCIWAGARVWMGVSVCFGLAFGWCSWSHLGWLS